MKKLAIFIFALMGLITVITGCATTEEDLSDTPPTFDNPEGREVKSVTTTTF